MSTSDVLTYQGSFEGGGASEAIAERVRPLYLDAIAPMLREYREMSTELDDALRDLEEILEVADA